MSAHPSSHLLSEPNPGLCEGVSGHLHEVCLPWAPFPRCWFSQVHLSLLLYGIPVFEYICLFLCTLETKLRWCHPSFQNNGLAINGVHAQWCTKAYPSQDPEEKLLGSKTVFTCNVVEIFKILYFHYYSDQVPWQRGRSVLAHSPREYDSSWQRWHGGVSRGSGCSTRSTLHFWHLRRQRGEGKARFYCCPQGLPLMAQSAVWLHVLNVSQLLQTAPTQVQTQRLWGTLNGHSTTCLPITVKRKFLTAGIASTMSPGFTRF